MPRTLVAIPALNEAATIGAGGDLVCIQLIYEVAMPEARIRRLDEDLALLTAQPGATPPGRPGTKSPCVVRSDNGSD